MTENQDEPIEVIDFSNCSDNGNGVMQVHSRRNG